MLIKKIKFKHTVYNYLKNKKIKVNINKYLIIIEIPENFTYIIKIINNLDGINYRLIELLNTLNIKYKSVNSWIIVENETKLNKGVLNKLYIQLLDKQISIIEEAENKYWNNIEIITFENFKILDETVLNLIENNVEIYINLKDSKNENILNLISKPNNVQYLDESKQLKNIYLHKDDFFIQYLLGELPLDLIMVGKFKNK